MDAVWIKRKNRNVIEFKSISAGNLEELVAQDSKVGLDNVKTVFKSLQKVFVRALAQDSSKIVHFGDMITLRTLHKPAKEGHMKWCQVQGKWLSVAKKNKAIYISTTAKKDFVNEVNLQNELKDAKDVD